MTAFLVGRPHLANTLILAIVVSVTALALIGFIPEVAPAMVLIGTVGLAGAVFDITGRTLLQRSVPSDAVAGSFSILESLMDLGLLLGTVLVRVSVAVAGLKAALFAPAAVVCVLLAFGVGRRLQKIDTGANVPQVEIQLLRSIPIFGPLPAPSLEGLARELETMEVHPGDVVVREGDRGEEYYAIASGQLTVSQGGQAIRVLSRGDGFGELALIRDVPRSASVTADTAAQLYSLRKDLFIQTVTGHLMAASAARSIIDGYHHTDNGDPGDGISRS